MRYRYEAVCRVHGLEIGGGDTPEECESNVRAAGCDIEEYSLFANSELANSEWENRQDPK